MKRDISGLPLVSVTANGREEIYECDRCGKNKLYVNTAKDVWMCHSCGEGGSVLRAGNSFSTVIHTAASPQTYPHGDLTSYAPLSFGVENGTCEFMVEALNRRKWNPFKVMQFVSNKTLDHFTRVGRNTTLGTMPHLCLPLYAVSPHCSPRLNKVGTSQWSPDSPSKRYQIWGERGVWTSSDCFKSKIPYATFIVEGFWDALSLWFLTFSRTASPEYTPLIIYTGGNQLTDSQVLSVQNIFGLAENPYHKPQIWVCYDNDKPAARSNSVERLRSALLGKCNVLAGAPTERFKDWDEFIHTDEVRAARMARNMMGQD